MSRGPGRIQQAIEAAFAGNPDGVFMLDDLVLLAYPGINRIEKKHRVATARAARLACGRTGWHWHHWSTPGGSNLYFNKRSIQSYGLVRTLGDFCRHWARLPWEESIPQAFERARKQLAERNQKYIQPGGVWHLHVAAWTAELDGDAATAARLNAEIDSDLAAFTAAFKAKPLSVSFGAQRVQRKHLAATRC